MKRKMLYAFVLSCGFSILSFAGSNDKCNVKRYCCASVLSKENTNSKREIITEETEMTAGIFFIPVTL